MSIDMDINENSETQKLFTKPKLAIPTVLLFVTIVSMFAYSVTSVLSGKIPLYLAVIINSVTAYISYTLLHEAAHGLISENRFINNWIGRLSVLLLTITPFFRTYRFLHMTHHRFTNDAEKDPDYFCGAGSAWTLPFRWLIMDLNYVRIYFQQGFYSTRPFQEKLEFWLSVLFGAIVLSVVISSGHIVEFLLIYFIPTRIALFLLVITFDYLPHYPHDVSSEVNKYHATSNRVGYEWLLTPLLLGQNYHLAHHLFPNAPFYRYKKIWDIKKHAMAEQKPAIVPAFELMPER